MPLLTDGYIQYAGASTCNPFILEETRGLLEWRGGGRVKQGEVRVYIMVTLYLCFDFRSTHPSKPMAVSLFFLFFFFIERIAFMLARFLASHIYSGPYSERSFLLLGCWQQGSTTLERSCSIQRWIVAGMREKRDINSDQEWTVRIKRSDNGGVRKKRSARTQNRIYTYALYNTEI